MLCSQCHEQFPEGFLTCPSCGTPTPSTPEDDPLLGRMLADKYVLQRKLGEGSFGAVYEAEEPQFNRKVAIKTLHPHLTKNLNVVERFRREGLAVSRLEHPCAVKMYDTGETDDHYLWIAMELLSGVPLDQYLFQKDVLTPKELLEILSPVCEVLAEAHEKGIIHRDLKPQNIFVIQVGDNVLAKPLDFGISKILEADTMTQSGIMMGTPAYMAPEQWEGAKHTTEASDIYALGIIAYQCLSGKLPFAADSAASWMKKHCIDSPLELNQAMAGREFPPRLGAVIMKTLSKKTHQRYPTTLAFLQALQDAIKEPPVLLPNVVEQKTTAGKMSQEEMVLELEASAKDFSQSLLENTEDVEKLSLSAPVQKNPSSEAEKDPAFELENPPPSKTPSSTKSAKNSFSGFPRSILIAGSIFLLFLLGFWYFDIYSLFFPKAEIPTPSKSEWVLPEYPKRFTQEDEVVVDTKTGLMWPKQDSKKSMKYEEAKEYCESLSLGGYTDWRLPTREEIKSLYTEQVPGHIPYCDRRKTNTDNEIHHYPEIEINCYGFWTSDKEISDEKEEAEYYLFSFQNGINFAKSPAHTMYVLPVRTP